VRHPHHGEPNGRRRHGCDPKATRAEVPRSGSCDMPLMLPSQPLVDTVRNTIKEPRSVAAQYATSNEAAQLRPALGNYSVALTGVTTQDVGEGTQGGRSDFKRPQPRPLMMAGTTSERTAPAWRTSRLFWAAARARCGCPDTTSRCSLRRRAQTTPTLSSISSGTVT
jgi:hypothetical protein